jgi:hypothetical protein
MKGDLKAFQKITGLRKFETRSLEFIWYLVPGAGCLIVFIKIASGLS